MDSGEHASRIRALAPLTFKHNTLIFVNTNISVKKYLETSFVNGVLLVYTQTSEFGWQTFSLKKAGNIPKKTPF